MARLGLALPQGVMTGPQIFAVRTLDFDNGLERFYQRFYINIDREKFDRWLVSLIPASVDMRWGCHFKSLEKEGDRFKIYFSRDGKTDFAYARMLIGADGAGSPVRRRPCRIIRCPKATLPFRSGLQPKRLCHTSRPFSTGKSAIFIPGPYLKKIT
jgi:2-polyprenyl-6-methoxyphenol hydroxylase-like FAD-dependent oxidoreductase